MLILAWLILPGIPHLVYTVSLRQAAAVCNGPLGVFGQLMGGAKVQNACSDVNAWMTGINVAGAVGVATLVVGLIFLASLVLNRQQASV